MFSKYYSDFEQGRKGQNRKQNSPSVHSTLMIIVKFLENEVPLAFLTAFLLPSLPQYYKNVRVHIHFCEGLYLQFA